MKARMLRKILNNTGYHVNNKPDYIAVGSPLCHDLISVDKETLKVKYALDTFHKGREALGNDELIFIWDKLHELIDTGQIHEIITGIDEIVNPLPVFTSENGKLIETFTDHYGWPNTTIEGFIMYDNAYFPTRRQAIDYGITEYGLAVESINIQICEKQKELGKVKERLEEYKRYIEYFRTL